MTNFAVVVDMSIPVYDDDGCTYQQKMTALIPVNKDNRKYIQNIKEHQKKCYKLYELQVPDAA